MILEMEIYWTKVFEGDGFTFTCNGWRDIERKCLKELSVEFFATVSFEEMTIDFDYNRALVFRLGGVYHEFSLCEFAWRMGLYTEIETESPFSVPFLHGCVRDFTPGIFYVQFWRTIANHEYNPHDASERKIRSPVHQFLHRLITFSINHKHHGDKVPIQNLFYLWSLVTPDICCDIPYMLARFLGNNVSSSRPGSPITGGHLVTRLA